MKKILLIALTLFITGAAFSQTTTPAMDKKSDMKDVRKDIRDVRKDKRQRTVAMEKGHVKKANHLTKNIRSDKKDIAKDQKTLNRKGVKHPIHRADKQIKRQDEKIKNKG